MVLPATQAQMLPECMGSFAFRGKAEHGQDFKIDHNCALTETIVSVGAGGNRPAHSAKKTAGSAGVFNWTENDNSNGQWEVSP